MKLALSSKRLQIDKAQQMIIKTVAIASVITVFCLVSSKTLLSQANYQRHVISARHQAEKQFKTNTDNAKQLANQYNSVFASLASSTNVLGGKNTRSANAIPPDGDNPRIVLDALPSSYDFPALISSVSKLLDDAGIINANIGGSDQSSTSSSAPSATPTPVPIQLTLSGSGSLSKVKGLIADLERSIRPMDITDLQLRGSNSNMSVSVTVTTYYQPAKAININNKAVK